MGIRIGNASGFYGDRFSAVEEMLTGGPLDVLTGDYLAELTMMILGRDRMRDPEKGYARTFLRQLEGTLATALDRGVKIVTNAGGLNPGGLAEQIRALARRLGLEAKVAYVSGDDLMDRAGELGLGNPLTANAYLGGWGITACLRAGADIVVTGRVTDASLVVGPAAAHFGWSKADFDALAGATVAGHILECGSQATGGNYSFFTEIPMGRLGFPIAEIEADGSCVITKHPGTGGAVTVGTVTAQLLYEVGGPRYLGPDVTTRFDTIRLARAGEDRVAVSGVRGEAPPKQLKVCLNHLAGFRNDVTFVLTGLDIEAKAQLVLSQLPGEFEWTLARTDRPDAGTQEQASALLRVTAKGQEPGREFSSAAVELALASYPGFTLTAPPTDATPYAVYTAAFVDAELVEHIAVLPDGSQVRIDPAQDGEAGQVEPAPDGEAGQVEPAPSDDAGEIVPETIQPYQRGSTKRGSLGTVVGARSGDKGGTANIGVWAKRAEAWPWLAHTLTVEKLKELLPEAASHEVTRFEFPNLKALNFVIDGILGEGVSSGTRFDPQGKGLGEWLRSRYIEIPEELL